ncbi:MAG: metalloregulator ArsR/SmtB family transcription factor [Sedimentisphaerales bacterium]|jgi:ArsR family transcriptional regulator|nr:metalloregulator ArsR/SmtB family transcription factor [Sedimentisphaerales bacterium]NLT78465.1 winged helix-turn-helix transcriptional regulator [Planctomycetota bacterium]
MGTSKNLLYEKQAEIAKAIAHPLRIAVIDFLKDGERCVCDIAEHIGSERSNVSRHLAVMVGAGVLSCRKEGLKVFYWLRTPCVVEFLGCATHVLKCQAKEHERILSAL